MNLRKWRALLSAAAVILAVVPIPLASAQKLRQIDWCKNKDGVFSSDEQISGCAELIRRDRLRTKDLAGALNSRGIGYYEKGDLDRAISDFTRAIRLNPKDAYTFNNRGQTYYAKGRLGRAIADYNRAIRTDPQAATAFFNRGIWYHEQGNLDRAIADYTRAARINPQDPAVFFKRSQAHYERGDLDRAIVDYRRAIRLDPK
jgi:tetratricopeptide (TPR) repeat protein